jgi:hypothetical protein
VQGAEGVVREHFEIMDGIEGPRLKAALMTFQMREW